MRKLIKRLLIPLLLLGAIGAALIIGFNVLLHAVYAARVYASIDDVPLTDQPRIAIV